jgi:hypothetical protein
MNVCVCSLAIVIQHANCNFSALYCVVLLSITCLAVQYFSTLSHKGNSFKRKNKY